MRIPKGFLDLLTVKFLTGYGQRPQHLLGAVGMLGFGVGSLGLVVLTIWRFASHHVAGLTPIHLHERAVFYYTLAALILGAQFMSVGMLAELLTAFHSQDRPSYSVAEQAGNKAAWEEASRDSWTLAVFDGTSRPASGRAHDAG
jgi:dolichol-phosphate mannosyltransferase